MLRFWSSKLHFWRKSRTKASFFNFKVSFLKEVSKKCFVFDLQSFIFEGSVAQKLRFWASKLRFWRTSRRNASFLIFKVSFLKEVSQKSFVFELQSFIFEGSLAEKLQSVSQSVSQLVSQSDSQSVSQSVSQIVSQSVSHSISQSVSQSVSHSVSPSVSQSIFQSVSHSVSPSVSQSIFQSPEHRLLIRINIFLCFGIDFFNIQKNQYFILIFLLMFYWFFYWFEILFFWLKNIDHILIFILIFQCVDFGSKVQILDNIDFGHFCCSWKRTFSTLTFAPGEVAAVHGSLCRYCQGLPSCQANACVASSHFGSNHNNSSSSTLHRTHTVDVTTHSVCNYM